MKHDDNWDDLFPTEVKRPMLRDRDDAVCTMVRETTTPVFQLPSIMEDYWSEVSRQCQGLIGHEGAMKLADELLKDCVLLSLYRESEQGRVQVILYLQGIGKL